MKKIKVGEHSTSVYLKLESWVWTFVQINSAWRQAYVGGKLNGSHAVSSGKLEG